MRFASVIIFTVLIQLGLFGRLAGNVVCCPDRSMQHSHVHDHDSEGMEHSHDDCDDDHNPPDRENCPPDCNEHNHHGTCFHSMQMSLTGDDQCHLSPPHAISLGCERQHLRAPDGPVMEMDKPPLI